MAVPTSSATDPTVGSFREAVCIDTRRIYDSCSAKDCLENRLVYFTDCDQAIIDQAISVKAKKAEVINVFLEVEEVPFNKGFFSVDITYFFLIKLAAYTSSASSSAIPVCGFTTFSKKVILFGSQGSVKTFTSDQPNDCTLPTITSLPKVSVQVVDPLILTIRLAETQQSCLEEVVCPPACVSGMFDGCFDNVVPNKQVYVSLGLFSIVQIERSVQMMIPAYDFCVPDRDCAPPGVTEDPCELFSRLSFPTDQFFPPRMSDLTSG